jgi:AraC family transcriptional activator of pobA
MAWLDMHTIPLNRLPNHELLLHIEPLGEEMPYDFRKPHRHDYFECFLFREGGGTHYIDFTAHPITARSVHVVFPGQVHLLHRRGARGHVIVCRKEFLAALPKALFASLQAGHYTNPCIYFETPGFEALNATLERLEAELSSPDALSAELVASNMGLLLAECIRRGTMEQAQPAQDIRHLAHYHTFCSLLDASQIDARKPVTYYAGQMGLSPKVLNESIRSASGKTCVALVQDRVLTEAKRRLLYTDESCKEIAYALAFKDCSYFTRFFKKLEGMTPVEFKAHWEEKYQHRA